MTLFIKTTFLSPLCNLTAGLRRTWLKVPAAIFLVMTAGAILLLFAPDFLFALFRLLLTIARWF
ncbi:hypothetical protein EJC49_09130 [Aquibium carbonis]|uniref:Uncharacterized protein n=1 Tax=Aquibium carbonis TaxID=2495581 RepID=A0A429YZ92_9HYPH|nr:hypothetical protein [Aquibium carbonis]RST86724.1 hypothetical protein EJC49_09130 [Aquibium carbonis]